MQIYRVCHEFSELRRVVARARAESFCVSSSDEVLGGRLRWLAVGMRFKVGDGELEEPLQACEAKDERGSAWGSLSMGCFGGHGHTMEPAFSLSCTQTPAVDGVYLETSLVPILTSGGMWTAKSAPDRQFGRVWDMACGAVQSVSSIAGFHVQLKDESRAFWVF